MVTQLEDAPGASGPCIHAKLKFLAAGHLALIQIDAVARELLDLRCEVTNVLRQSEASNFGRLHRGRDEIRVGDAKHRGRNG